MTETFTPSNGCMICCLNMTGDYVRTSDYQSLQAKLDAVMLEYCPDDMTSEQLEEWGRNQVKVPRVKP